MLKRKQENLKHIKTTHYLTNCMMSHVISCTEEIGTYQKNIVISSITFTQKKIQVFMGTKKRILF